MPKAKPAVDETRPAFVARSIVVRLDLEQIAQVLRGLLALDPSLFPPDGEVVGWWADQTCNPPRAYLRIASREFDPVDPGDPWPEPIVKPYKDDDGRRWLSRI